MRGKRIRLTEDQAVHLGRKWKGLEKNGRSPRYSLKPAEIKKLEQYKISVSNKSETKPNDYKEPKFVLSAWNKDGYMMDIDEYCEHYKLPRKDISSYKLISHTGVPYYNIVFKENIEGADIDYKAVIDNVIKRKTQPIRRIEPIESKTFATRLIYTDVHVGMDTDKEGRAMYPEQWNRESIFDSCILMAQYVLKNKVGNCLYIDDLGDMLDGFDGKTVRRQHDLPQNMTNEEAFETALEFKIKLLDLLHNEFDYIYCHNICNDNHSGSFGANMNYSFKRFAEASFNNVKVDNVKSFIGHYYIGRLANIITHGKDMKHLKFGFKTHLDPKQIEHIDQYLKFNNIFQNSDHIDFSKGDSHQCLYDYSTSQDFDYMNHPALSPSSEWVQTNYKRGRRGFSIQQIDIIEKTRKTIPIFI